MSNTLAGASSGASYFTAHSLTNTLMAFIIAIQNINLFINPSFIFMLVKRDPDKDCIAS